MKIIFSIITIISLFIPFKLSFAGDYGQLKATCRSQSMKQQCEKALDTCKKALVLEPSDGDIYGHIAFCYMVKQEKDLAQDWLNKGFQIDPNSAQLNHSKANLELVNGDLDSAIKYSERAITKDPEFKLSYWILAHTYNLKKDWQNSIKYFTKCLKFYPNGMTHSRLGYSYEKSGLLEKAIFHYEKAQELGLANEQVNDELSESLKKLYSIVKNRKQGSQQIIAKYKNSQKPKNFNEIKKLLSLKKDWKISVYAYKNERGKWVISPSEYNYLKDPKLIFEDLPIDFSPYKKNYFLFEAEIDRKFDDYFIVKDNADNEAIAEIPQKVIKRGSLHYGDACYMVCKLVDILDVETIIGSNKQVAQVEVYGVFHKDEYDAFIEYALGHPEEFPQEKYVVITYG